MNLLGAYVPGSSPLHRIDPCIRMLSFSIIFASIAISDSICGYLLSLAAVVLLYRIAAVPLMPSVRSLWRFRAFFITVFLMNAFFQPSDDPYLSWWIVVFSSDGMLMGARMVLSVILLTLLSSLLTAVATPIAITDGLRTLLHPLSILRIPVDEASAIVSIAISFIPVLAAESRSIMLSAASRGAVPEGRRAKERALSLIPLVLPLFLSAFRRADELATAMEARGYRGERVRRRRISLVFGRREAFSLLISISLLIGAIALKGVL